MDKCKMLYQNFGPHTFFHSDFVVHSTLIMGPVKFNDERVGVSHSEKDWA